jgi:hypothetical protein
MYYLKLILLAVGTFLLSFLVVGFAIGMFCLLALTIITGSLIAHSVVYKWTQSNAIATFASIVTFFALGRLFRFFFLGYADEKFIERFLPVFRAKD